MGTKKFGSRADVWDGVCSMTRGGLCKADLVMSKTGKLVSKKKSELAKANYKTYGFVKRKQAEEAKEEKVEAPKKAKRKRKTKKKAQKKIE